MGFNLLIFASDAPGQFDVHDSQDWPRRLKELIPGITVDVARSTGEAMELIQDADAAYGDVQPDLFARAGRLRWIACPQAGPSAGYYHRALIDSDVVVTNVRGIYNDYISAHIMAFLLAFATGLPAYYRSQLAGKWRPGEPTVYLPDSTAVIVGVGGIGGETARICTQLGIEVLGVDPRVAEAPTGIAELHRPESLDDVLPRGDFVIVTVPESPKTQGMFGARQFHLMKNGAYFINIGRGATVDLDELDAALRAGEIAGAALDVFETEPLPAGHPLWTAPGMLITPHVAAASGPILDDRRTELFMDNCVRFSEGRPLRNVVDKENWY